MLLRLIDKANAQHEIDKVEVCLQTADREIIFTVDEFTDPIGDYFYQLLTWYFNQYLQSLTLSVDDKGVGEKLIRSGQALGDGLLGEDFELMQVRDLIEEVGYDQVRVQLESSRIAFFQTAWELLILPDAKFVLSASSREFVRRFTGDSQPDYETEKHFELHGGSDDVDALPLSILHITAYKESDNRPVNVFNRSIQTLRWGDAIDYRLWLDDDLTSLYKHLDNPNQPVHIIHYDGPIYWRNAMPHLPLDQSGESVALDDFCKQLTRYNVSLLVIEACSYWQDDHDAIDAGLGLASIAQIAAKSGLTNVVGLNQLTDPWTSSECFACFYDRILSGLSLGQAVVETRKQLQTRLETQRFRVDSIPFHPWHLLTHYGGQDVYFFEQPQPLTELAQSSAYQRVRELLLGFHSHYLPPDVNHVEDKNLLALLEVSFSKRGLSNTIFCIEGSAGSGKTHLVHQAAFSWAQQQCIDYGFYFDLSEGLYTREDVKRMIAPILETDPDHLDQLDTALQVHRCCFVFDNLDKLTTSRWPEATAEAIEELTTYLGQLAQQHHIVITTSREGQRLMDTPILLMKPLHLLSQYMLAAHSLRSARRDVKQSDWRPLLAHLQGNPFLIQQLLPQWVDRDNTEVINEIHSWSEKPEHDNTYHYYQWQWHQLPLPWRYLLQLVADLPTVPLEMLGLACRKPTKPDNPGFEPAIELFRQLEAASDSQSNTDKKNLDFSMAVDSWRQAGLLLQRSYGSTIDPRLREFISCALKDETLPIDTILVSQILCEGIRQLAQHLQQQPNPVMLRYLLANRQHWAKHFEALWFGQHFRSFLAVKQAFDGLLRSAGLEKDSAAWSLDLLTRTEMPTASDDPPIASAWLQLAFMALAADGAAQHPLLIDAASVWRDWLTKLTIDESLHPCFRPAVQWLCLLYQRQQQWSDCCEISDIAYHHDHHHQHWPYVIDDLRRLAQCSVALQDHDQARHYEKLLLEELPFDQLPPRLSIRLRLEVASARIARGELQGVEDLMIQLRDSDESTVLKPTLDALQADLDYQRGHYPDALTGYCHLWENATKQPGPYRQQLQQRLIELREKLGHEHFDAVSEKMVGRVITSEELNDR